MTRIKPYRPGNKLLVVVSVSLALLLFACDDEPAGQADAAPDVVEDVVGDPDADAFDDPDTFDTIDEPDLVEDISLDPDLSEEPDAADLGVDSSDQSEEEDLEPPECAHACDCAQGYDCVADTCVLGDTAVLCCTQMDCTEGNLCVNSDDSLGLCGVDYSAFHGDVIFNEILSDGETGGDPNGDGDESDAAGDEFVEIVNTSASAVDIEGFTLVEEDLSIQPRHTFGAGDSIPAGDALVVFGGGTAPDDITGASFTVAASIPPGLLLGNGGDSIRLFDDQGKLVAIFAWGPGTPQEAITDQSATRSPDLTGDFVPHSTAPSSEGRLFSPGTQLDGSTF